MGSNTNKEENYYKLLGISPDATTEQIRTVYREIARVYHPDSNFYDEIVPTKVSQEQVDVFKIITAAYNTLTDAKQRAKYDAELKAAQTQLRGWEENPEDIVEAAQCKPGSGRRRTMTASFGKFVPEDQEQSDPVYTRGRERPRAPTSVNLQSLTIRHQVCAVLLVAGVIAAPIAVLLYFVF